MLIVVFLAEPAIPPIFTLPPTPPASDVISALLTQCSIVQEVTSPDAIPKMPPIYCVVAPNICPSLTQSLIVIVFLIEQPIIPPIVFVETLISPLLTQPSMRVSLPSFFPTMPPAIFDEDTMLP